MDILKSESALSDATSGAIADAFSTLALYPLDKVKILMQADSSITLSDAIRRTAKKPFTGIESKLLSSVQQKFQYFYVYKILYEFVKRARGGQKPGVVIDLALGYLAALEGLVSTLPLEVTNTRVITTTNSDGSHPSFLKTFLEQWRHEGFRSFYKTLSASAVLCLNPAITYVIFEEIKGKILASKKLKAEVLTAMEALLVGTVAKSIATVVTFPFIRAKVLMSIWKKKMDETNAKRRDEGKPELQREQPHVVETLREVYETEGFRGLFIGLEPQLIKGVSNAALMLVVKEEIYSYVKRLF